MWQCRGEGDVAAADLLNSIFKIGRSVDAETEMIGARYRYLPETDLKCDPDFPSADKAQSKFIQAVDVDNAAGIHVLQSIAGF